MSVTQTEGPLEKEVSRLDKLRHEPVVVGLAVAVGILGGISIVREFATSTVPWLADIARVVVHAAGDAPPGFWTGLFAAMSGVFAATLVRLRARTAVSVVKMAEELDRAGARIEMLSRAEPERVPQTGRPENATTWRPTPPQNNLLELQEDQRIAALIERPLSSDELDRVGPIVEKLTLPARGELMLLIDDEIRYRKAHGRVGLPAERFRRRDELIALGLTTERLEEGMGIGHERLEPWVHLTDLGRDVARLGLWETWRR